MKCNVAKIWRLARSSGWALVLLTKWCHPALFVLLLGADGLWLADCDLKKKTWLTWGSKQRRHRDTTAPSAVEQIKVCVCVSLNNPSDWLEETGICQTSTSAVSQSKRPSLTQPLLVGRRNWKHMGAYKCEFKPTAETLRLLEEGGVRGVNLRTN